MLPRKNKPGTTRTNYFYGTKKDPCLTQKSRQLNIQLDYTKDGEVENNCLDRQE
ncbi:hypothetical protein LPAF129_14940 [Ligilactobacillus pabuli]|uniref:Transposase n=1 Tax=Ligilactobacillus pabuli TaxID=2886039 RepID=A0ABQ5JIT8_9LACO|nr:hypothetical protein LPAF129_14940 [Ligilactobacillus pabuli]